MKQIKPMGMDVDNDPAMLEEIKRVTKLRASGDFKNTLPVREINIPEAVLITCPLARQHFIQAKCCKECKHFRGVVQTTYNDEYVMQWDHKYAVSCACPTDRKCSSVSISV